MGSLNALTYLYKHISDTVSLAVANTSENYHPVKTLHVNKPFEYSTPIELRHLQSLMTTNYFVSENENSLLCVHSQMLEKKKMHCGVSVLRWLLLR